MNARSRRCPPQAGFTLLETIVTLVIVSLIVVVLMQALQQSLGLRTRLLRFERETRMSTLQEQWFRDTVSSAMIDLPDALGIAEGDADRFAMVVAAPLQGAGPARIAWAIQRDGGGQTLVYEAGGGALRVVGGLHDASFAYLDAEGRWRNTWKQEDRAPLPRMVRFQAATSTGALLWLVPVEVDGRERRLLRPEEIDLGL